jgi:DNA-directed RNA polymerase specialized sigma24 family protein
LSEKHRSVFVLREIEELSVSETAEALAKVWGRGEPIPKGSIKGWLNRAKRELVQCLQKEGWEV